MGQTKQEQQQRHKQRQQEYSQGDGRQWQRRYEYVQNEQQRLLKRRIAATIFFVFAFWNLLVVVVDGIASPEYVVVSDPKTGEQYRILRRDYERTQYQRDAAHWQDSEKRRRPSWREGKKLEREKEGLEG